MKFTAKPLSGAATAFRQSGHSAFGWRRSGIWRGVAGLMLALILVAAEGVAAPGAALAATSTISCGDMTLAQLNVRSEADTAQADLNTGTCAVVPHNTTATYDSGFSVQAYTEGAAAGGAPFWILPSSVIGGVAFRFNSSNPVQCTGAGCSNWPRGDYAVCSPLAGACHFTASFDVGGFPTSISGDVPAGQYKITNISISYEPTVIPPPPNVAPVFSGMPSNISVNTDPGLATAVVTFTAPTANDDVDGPVTPALTAGLPSGSAFPLGVTTITYTATDNASNAATASFTVTVSDREKPVIAQVANITAHADSGLTTAAVNFSASVSDNVDRPSRFTPVFKIGSTVISSGHTFPLGVTTVTVGANADTAGNTPDPISFTVTVDDNQAPDFAGFPSNINLEVDYPNTGATASWAEPTATDNAPGASVTLTAGLPSGSRFPLGTTTVTYEARDGAQNAYSRSFTVTVTQRAAGSVTFVVSSSADRTFTFTSPERALNVAVATLGGGGSSGNILLGPGTYSFAFAVPSDIGIASATCSNGGTIDASAHTGSVTLASGLAVTCAIKALDSVRDTVATLAAMSIVRSELILTGAPDLDRRLARLNDAATGGTIEALGMAYFSENLPMSFQVNGDAGSFALSLREAQGTTASASAAKALADGGLVSDPTDSAALGDRFDIWLEGKYARFDAAGGRGGFGVLHGGVDYLLTNDILVGVGAQLDWIGMDSPSGVGHADGQGFMIGPYLTANLAPGFYFDARAAFGSSRNTVSPYGTYSDSTLGQRGLVTAALGGELKVDALEIRPEARLSWYREQIAGYTDSLNVQIPAVAVETGTLTFGPTFRLPYEVGNGATLTPFASVNGIWTFAQTNTAGSVSGQPGLSAANLRAALEMGFDLTTIGGLSLSASATYDGIGTTDYRALGGHLSVGQKF